MTEQIILDSPVLPRASSIVRAIRNVHRERTKGVSSTPDFSTSEDEGSVKKPRELGVLGAGDWWYR